MAGFPISTVTWRHTSPSFSYIRFYLGYKIKATKRGKIPIQIPFKLAILTEEYGPRPWIIIAQILTEISLLSSIYITWLVRASSNTMGYLVSYDYLQNIIKNFFLFRLIYKPKKWHLTVTGRYTFSLLYLWFYLGYTIKSN